MLYSKDKQIERLQEALSKHSWDGYVDTASGAFTQDEINRSRFDKW